MTAGIAAQARMLALLRLLLVAIALAAVTLGVPSQTPQAWQAWQHILIIAVSLFAGVLALTVPWVRARWQLAFHLVCDLVWIGLLVLWSGGVTSPVVALLFALVVIGNVVLPGYVPFLLPALASTVLGVIATLSLTDQALGLLPAQPPAVGETPARVLAHLILQIPGLFVVDALAAHLVRRASEQRLVADSMLEQLGEGVLAVDHQQRLLYANAEALRLLGIRETPAVGAPLSLEILPQAQILLLGERVPNWLRHTTADGRELVLRVGELHGRRGRSVGRILVIADETRLRLLENTAKRSEALAALGEMAAGIAHEVRNPLTSLRGCAQELAEAASDHGRADDAALARMIVAEADRLERIVSEFLALSRMPPPQRRPCQIAEVISGVVALLRLRPDLPPGLAIVSDCAPHLPPCEADPEQLRQALINLALNAIEAMRQTAERRLAISAQLAQGDNPFDVPALRLVVSDTGVGIPSEHLSKVFTPFWSSKPQGTGLGLSIVSRIVRDHEGVLRISSTPGRGTEVTIFLPAPTPTQRFRQAMGAA
ncbi:MAG: ATP-binding protein [Planctomycetes bacterium]|nr:ATP-binding protein [Planctomycetota bacterium]